MSLKTGDKVALVAPARKVTPEEMAPAVRILEQWGLQVVVPEGLYASDYQFAGDDRHRASILQAQLNDSAIRAIFCARGGYGTVRIVDLIDFETFFQMPKWIVGYSDITVLHIHVASHAHIPTLHAMMPVNFPSDVDWRNVPALVSMHQLLFEDEIHYRFECGGSVSLNRNGKCCAPIVGGNLSVLYSLLASPSDIDTDGKILLLEDLDEYLYHIDRMMRALRRSGKLSGLKGLLVGSMSDMHDNTIPFGRTAEEIVFDTVSDYDYPVAFHCPFGHIGNQNCALPLNRDAVFEVSGNEVKLSF